MSPLALLKCHHATHATCHPDLQYFCSDPIAHAVEHRLRLKKIRETLWLAVPFIITFSVIFLLH